MENLGGHLNAYTSREQTVYYAKVFKTDVARAVDIISDILQNSTLEPWKVDRERDVILREAREVDKQTEEVVFDHLHSVAFPKSPLGMTILGPAENIRTITRNDLCEYVRENYHGERMVFAAAGAVNHEELVNLVDAAYTRVPKGTVRPAIATPAVFTPGQVRVARDDVDKAHVALAIEGVHWTHPDYFALMVAQAITGSWDRSLAAGGSSSSRLAQLISRKQMADSFMSFNTCYTDTGLHGVYFVSSQPNRVSELIEMIQSEWQRLGQGVSDEEVRRAKTQLKCAILMQLDGTTMICEDIGRQMLTYGRRMTPFEIDARIEDVDPARVQDVARRYLAKPFALAAVGNVESVPVSAVGYSS